MGAGAIGAYFGARLQQAGEEVVFCARGQHLRALQAAGLQVQSIQGDFVLEVKATATPADFKPYDLILLCVKSNDTESAAAQLSGCLAAGGAILTLQNGVENETRLAAIFGADSVMAGNARIAAELLGPGRIRHLAAGYIEFGEMDGRITERTRRYAAAMERAGILGALSDQIRVLRWEKLMWNASFNTICTLTRRTVGEVLDNPSGRELARQVIEEVRMVAAAQGVTIPPERTDALLEYTQKNFRASRTSTLLDLEQGKRLEVDALIGVVDRLARHHGLHAPAAATIHRLLALADPGAAPA